MTLLASARQSELVIGSVRFDLSDPDDAWIEAPNDHYGDDLRTAWSLAAECGLEIIPPDEAPPVYTDTHTRYYLTEIM